MKNQEKVIHELVEWCIERTEKVSEDDMSALLQEFDEWILYENGEVPEFDFLSFSVKN